jgi:hypothetical protein
MNVKAWPLESKYQTVREIKHAVKTYYKDLLNFPKLINMTTEQFYEYVKKLPYTKDMPDAEIVSRPQYLLSIFNALDCKKKSILFGSFMRLKHGPGTYRFVLSSTRPDGKICHIFTQILSNGNWINADATYSHNVLGSKKRVTNYEIVKG